MCRGLESGASLFLDCRGYAD